MKDRNSSIDDAAWFQQRDLFIGDFYGGEEGYHTCRIPALIVSKKGTILAFCEGREYTGRDADKIDILLKRSFDEGKSWQDKQIIVTDDGMTCGNPCPVVDQSTGTIWLPFCKNLRYNGRPSDRLIAEGKDPRTVWITKSTDDGATWAISKLLNEGPSAYSDLTIAPDMTICCLYERGEKFCSEKLTLARFNLEWLTDGTDKLQPKI